MKIAIVAGGSGGHIYPAVSLAESLIAKGHELTFFGSNDRMEKDVIPSLGYKYIGLNVLITTGSIINKIRSVFSMVVAYFKCLKLLKGFDMVIGFGNYISVPVVLAGKKIGLKVVLHEQNSFVGRANRMLDLKADYIIGSYEENLNQFKNKNIAILGNPQSSKALKVQRDSKVLEDLGLNSNLKTVLIFMGSLGSESINNKLYDYFEMLDGSYQVIYATGKDYYKEVCAKVKETDYLKIFERVDGALLMANVSMLVSRAGATTISEICATGTPSILIPSPYVPNNHQFKNAMSLVNKDAAEILEEKDFTIAKLKQKVETLINDDVKLKKMHDNARKLNNDTVIEDIIEVIENL